MTRPSRSFLTQAATAGCEPSSSAACLSARGILGLSAEASFEETRTRFRTLAKLHHPDLNPGKDGTDFVLVSAAYLELQVKEGGRHIQK
jgi:hypothetical protein